MNKDKEVLEWQQKYWRLYQLYDTTLTELEEEIIYYKKTIKELKSENQQLKEEVRYHDKRATSLMYKLEGIEER